MLEVHAILHRQRCYENMTEKTGTLSDAYSLFEDIIEIKNREICIKPGVNANDIDKLLEIDKNIEKVDRKNLFAIYTEVSSCL